MSVYILFIVLLVIALVIGIQQLAKSRRSTVRPRGSWRRWVAVAGIGLLALPGLINVAHALFVTSSADFLQGKEIMVPTGLSVGDQDADVFLARALVTIDGAEDFPIDYVQGVIPLNGCERFALRDGRELTIHLIRRQARQQGQRFNLHYQLEGASNQNHGSGAFEGSNLSELESGYDLFQKTANIRSRSARPLGSLFSSTAHPGAIRFWVTPLANAESVDTMPAGEWRQKYASAISALSDRSDSGWESQGGGSGLEFGAVTGSGFVLMILGALCLVLTSAHGLRTGCIVCVCIVAYAGAVDGVVVAIETSRLDHDSPARIAAAAIETAGTLMHPITAAEELLALAASDKSVDIRALAVRCLDRERILSALREMSDSRDSLQKVARSDDPELARSARDILSRLAQPADQPMPPSPYESGDPEGGSGEPRF